MEGSTAPKALRVAAISGSLRRGSANTGLIRAAKEICEESIPGLVVNHVDISDLPLLNTDMEIDGGFPPAVEAFRARVRAADCFLFASPEYNYSISGPALELSRSPRPSRCCTRDSAHSAIGRNSRQHAFGTPSGTISLPTGHHCRLVKLWNLQSSLRKKSMPQFTIESLTEEQKQQMDQAIAEFQERCLRCFVMTPQGPVQKVRFPEPMIASFEDIFDQALHRVLSDQSGALKKDLEDLVKKKMDECIAQRDQLGGQPSQHRPEEFPQYRQGEEHYYVQDPALCRYKDDLADKVAEVVHEHFGIKPKEQIYLYQHPYPEWFDEVPLPYDYQVPEFSKFSGQDNTSTMEHISRFLAQCGEASADEALRVRLFPLSLSGSVFTWFSSLPRNSVKGWADLEKQFHQYFFIGHNKMGLTDLISVKQQEDESVLNYIRRFRDMRSRCYGLDLSDGQLADFAFQGLSTPIKEKFSCYEFESLSHLLQKASAHESRLRETKRFWSYRDQEEESEDNFEA